MKMKKTITMMVTALIMCLGISTIAMADTFYMYQPDFSTCTSNESNTYFSGCTGPYENFTGIGIDFIYLNSIRQSVGCDQANGFLTNIESYITYQPVFLICNAGANSTCIYAGNQAWQNNLTELVTSCNGFGFFLEEAGYTQRIYACIPECSSGEQCNNGTCEIIPVIPSIPVEEEDNAHGFGYVITSARTTNPNIISDSNKMIVFVIGVFIGGYYLFSKGIIGKK
jgi:hypothetical protein